RSAARCNRMGIGQPGRRHRPASHVAVHIATGELLLVLVREVITTDASCQGKQDLLRQRHSAVTVSHYSTRSCASASSRSSRCMYLCVVEMLAWPSNRRAYSIPFSRQIFVPHSCRARYSTRSRGRPARSRRRKYVRLRFGTLHPFPAGDRKIG